MKKKTRKALSLSLAGALCASLVSGCAPKEAEPQAGGGHEPLTILTAGMRYGAFQELLAETYPEVRLEFISYIGANGTGYSQYLLRNGEIPDICSQGVFTLEEEQQNYLLDLSGYEFCSNYKTADINQVTLNGGVYMLPASQNIIGLYYNRTLFQERGWTVPQNLDEFLALSADVRAAGLRPVAAQFGLAGNGFFDLFTMAKTDFLSTPEGLQWERDFQAGKATAAEGLAGGAELLQTLIDNGVLDPADTERSDSEVLGAFFGREAAMYMNAGTLPRFTQNEDGTGDTYGIMPFFGKDPGDTVIVSLPIRYYGLSKTLAEPGNEQKLEDALKVMSLLATEKGQASLQPQNTAYIAPLKNSTIPEDSPFLEVRDVIQSGHTTTLAHAGYEPILIDVGNKVTDWVAGKCTKDEVLKLIDECQSAYLANGPVFVVEAAQEIDTEQTAQLEAEAIRQAVGADVGLVSLSAYYDGVQNDTGICGKMFAGGLDQEDFNTIMPSSFLKTLSVLTLTGADIKALLETGLVKEEGAKGFPYVPAGIVVTKDGDGAVKGVTLADGSPFDEAAVYTVSFNRADFSEETGQKGAAKETELVMADVVTAYLKENSPLVPLAPSLVG